MCIRDSKIVEEVVLDSEVLNSDDNDVNYNSEVSRSENYDNIRKNMVLKNNGVNIESTCLLYTSRCV